MTPPRLPSKPMPGRAVRRITEADLAEVLAVRTSVLENRLTQDQLTEKGITEKTLLEMLASTHRGWCIDVGEQLAGFAMADGEHSTIFALFVRPEFEGQGHGSALLDTAVDWLRSAGHQQASLTTDPGTRAFSFYPRQGWHHRGTAPNGEAAFALPLSPSDR